MMIQSRPEENRPKICLEMKTFTTSAPRRKNILELPTRFHRNLVRISIRTLLRVLLAFFLGIISRWITCNRFDAGTIKCTMSGPKLFRLYLLSIWIRLEHRCRILPPSGYTYHSTIAQDIPTGFPQISQHADRSASCCLCYGLDCCNIYTKSDNVLGNVIAITLAVIGIVSLYIPWARRRWMARIMVWW